MSQIFVKRDIGNGTNQLLRADILSRNGDKLQVKVEGERHSREVDASDTLPMDKYYGNAKSRPGDPLLTRHYPESVNSLGYLLNR